MLGCVLNLGGGEILVILVLALLVLGPSRLPNAGRQVGRALAEFRRMSAGVQSDLKEALDAEGMRETVSQVRDVLDVQRTIRNEVASAISAVGSTSVSGSSATSSTPSTSQPVQGEASIPPPDGAFSDEAVIANNESSGVVVPPPSQSSANEHGIW